MKKVIFFVVILLAIFLSFYYKPLNFGNNISIKNEDKIVDYILNISDYEAEIEVTIKSNKTENVYRMNQIEKAGYSLLEVTSNGKINGLKIEYENGNLSVQNTDLKLDKIYENYEPVMNNSLFLGTFIKEFQEEEGSTYQEGELIVLKTENKILYVDNQTAKPTKLEIKDNTKKTSTSIEYINIEIN